MLLSAGRWKQSDCWEHLYPFRVCQNQRPYPCKHCRTGIRRLSGSPVCQERWFHFREYSNYITSATSSSINKGWERLTLTFTVPKNTDYARFGLIVMNATGEAWFDGIQLEKAPGASNYNLLENSSLEEVDGNLPAGWYTANLSSTDTISTAAKARRQPLYESGRRSWIQQADLPANRPSPDSKESDTYIAGAWAKANAVPESSVNNRLYTRSRVRLLQQWFCCRKNTNGKVQPCHFRLAVYRYAF